MVNKPKEQKHADYRYGLWAEKKAIEYLEQQGYTLIAQRARTPYGEIDLIMQSPQPCLCFIEVKARKTLEDALYALSPRQYQRIANGALHYVATHPHYAQFDQRIDLIAIAGWQIHHECNIVLA